MLLEYDIEIRTTKLIKGQGLAKMMTNQLDTGVQVMSDFFVSPWYSDIVCVAKFTGSCRVKKNKSKVSEVEICQVLYPKSIPLLERSWWCFT